MYQVYKNPLLDRFNALLDGVDEWSEIKVADMDSVSQSMTAIEAGLDVAEGDWKEAYEVLNASDRISPEAKGIAYETLLSEEIR